MCRWGLKKLSSVLGNFISLSAFVLFLSACSERDIKMAFLNGTTKGNQGDFVIDTGSGGGSELSSEGVGPVELNITCDKAIDKIEVENPQTREWRDVTELASGTVFDCATSGQAKLQLPLEHVAPYQAPSKPGDMAQDFQIRWHVKDLLGEVQVFYRTLTLKFKAPELLLEQAADINSAAVGGGSYMISGSCAESGGVVVITGPFSGSPISGNCDDSKNFSLATQYTGGTRTDATIRVTHSKAGAFRSYSEVEKVVKVDVVEPTVTMESVTSDPANSVIAIKVTFSEPVRDFKASDVILSSGQVSGFGGSGNVYTFSVSPANQGLFTATIEQGSIFDLAGNPNSSEANVTRTFDSVRPAVTLASAAPNNTSSNIPVIVTFSESVTGFTASDVVVSSGTVTGFSGSGKSYSFSVTPTNQGVFSVSIAEGVAADVAGNTNTAATTLTRNFDSVQPTLTLASTTSASTNTSPIPVAVTFSESVSNFTASDVGVTNGTISGFTGSGANYSFSVTPSAQGVVTVSVAADVATDVAGNGNAAASSLTRTFDSVKPTVSLTSTAPSLTNIASIPVTVTFSEPVTGFTAADVTVLGGTVGTVSGSGTTYNFTVTASAVGSVVIDLPAGGVTDAAGNTNVAASTLSRVFDNVKPTATITSTAPATTNAAIPVTVTFSESVTDFTSAEVVVTNGVVSSFSGTGTTYTMTVTPSAQGAVSVAVGASVAFDAAGNPNTAATTLNRTYDSVAPTVTLATAAAASTNAAFSVTATFSKSVTGFVAADVSVTNASVSGFSGSGTTYSFTVTPTAQGTVSVSVAASVAVDSVGNGNAASSSLTRTYDSVKPTVTMTSSAPSTTNTAIPVTVSFSEAVTGFASSDVTLSSGTISGFSGSGASYSFTVTPSVQGIATIGIAAGVAQDAAGNTNSAATSLTRTYDTVPPVLSSVSLSSTTYLNRTAAINFSTEAGAVVEARIENAGNSALVMDWQQVTSGFYHNTTTSPGAEYRYVLRARDVAGNVSADTIKTMFAFSCPNEFVYIHNPNVAGVAPFCVGQFEAKMVGGVPRFIASYTPSSLSMMDATAACTGMGDGFDLISNTEWNAIADLIARQATNWTSGTAGTGVLHRGDTQSATPTAANVADSCAPNTSSLCTSNGLRRLHYLPYNMAIWDFAGNAAEVIKDADSVVYADASYLYPSTSTAYALDTKYGTTLSCSASGSPDYCGFGKIDFTNTNGGISTIWRGGAAYDGNTAGVFAAKRATNAAGTLSNGGFRCVYRP